MTKVALFAFNGEATCFAHVLLNALDMQDKGFDVRVIIEAEATKQVSLLRNETKPYADLYRQVKDAGLIECVCKACATKFGALNAAIQQGLASCGEMSGHPSIGRYMQDGFQVFVF
ncbi:MAG: DsrE family protein [candidate division WOR-3 bacterium]|nr:MAG: DsrE family protein [candidate division WOR-3 bacterium]